MREVTERRTVTVINPQGLHARPVDLFVRLANQFGARIEVIKGGERADGKSILSILTLAAQQGTQLDIEATGDDADVAIAALAELVKSGFAVEEENNQHQMHPES